MLHAMRRRRDDAGFTMIEAIVIVVIIGILTAIVVPSFMAQKARTANASIKGDLRNIAVAGNQFYTENFAYPTTAQGFAFRDAGVNTGVPTTSPQNTYRVFVVKSGAKAGFVAYGISEASSKMFVVSSWEDTPPHEVVGPVLLPTSPPPAGTLGIPAGVTNASWVSPSGIGWGAHAAP